MIVKRGKTNKKMFVCSIDVSGLQEKYELDENPEVIMSYQFVFKFLKSGIQYTKNLSELKVAHLQYLPKRKEEISIEDTYIGGSISLEKVIEKARAQGFNQCLDELFGKENDR